MRTARRRSLIVTLVLTAAAFALVALWTAPSANLSGRLGLTAVVFAALALLACAL